MAENTESPRIDLKEKYKKDLSVGTYAVKQIADIVISFGSMILGGIAGNYIGNTYAKSVTIGQEELKRFGVTWNIHPVGAMVGAMAGGMIGGIIQGYSRWKKHESERLAVSEINEDVANMKIRYRTDPELVRENARLREMLEQEEQRTIAMQQQSGRNPAQQIVEQGARSPRERADMQEERSL